MTKNSKERSPIMKLPITFSTRALLGSATAMAAVGILFNMHRQGIYHEAQPTKPSTPKSYSVRM